MFTGTWCSGPLACFRGQCSSCDPESFRSSAGQPPTPATPLEPTIEGAISYPGAFRVASETRVLAQRTCQKRKHELEGIEKEKREETVKERRQTREVGTLVGTSQSFLFLHPVASTPWKLSAMLADSKGCV